MKTIVIAGALDTKGSDFAYLQRAIQQSADVELLMIDFGVMGEPEITPDITRRDIAEAGGGDQAYLSSGEHKDLAMETMARGLTVIVRRLYDENRLDGIISMGGSGGTSIATTAMRALPIGIPKVMVSTVGGGDVSAYAGMKDIIFIPSIVDVAGINRISQRIYANAAGAIAGMVQAHSPTLSSDKPLIAASMFGNTTTAVNHARSILEDHGYEVLVFHATGIGGKTMESLIADGFFAGALDITTTELADTVCGGVFDAGEHRTRAASEAGVPAVLVPGCVDMANFDAIDTVPERYRGRNLYQWNPNVTLLRTNVEENRQIGTMIAASANAASAPVAILLPLNGVSMLDSTGNAFWDPDADAACFDAIRQNVKSSVPIIELEHNINDPEFSAKAVELLLDMLAP